MQRKSISLIIILFMLLAGIPTTPARAATSIVTESFQNTTAPNWLLLGTAELTETTVDADGAADGWLRLTNIESYSVGTAVYNTPVSGLNGLDIEFDYAVYGGSGADGLVFYLIDGTTATPTLGWEGSALGYEGVSNPYVGIGFDEFGGFAGTGSASTAIRGSQFQLLTSAPADIETGDRANSKHVHIRIDESQRVSVWLDGSLLIDQFDLSSDPDQLPMPNLIKLGFSAATGGMDNIHEVRNLVVSSILDRPLMGVDSTKISFTNQPVGVVSPSQPLTLTNMGGTNLDIGTLTASTEFGITEDACSNETLLPGEICSFKVFYLPTAKGYQIGSITIPSNAHTSPDSAPLLGGTPEEIGVMERISLASDSTEGNLDSSYSSISSDGRFVAFASYADNLVEGDTNGHGDIFVRDTQSGVTTRVSLASDGSESNNVSDNPSISANGRFIAFASLADNLVEGDTNGAGDVFVRDTQSGTTTRISLASDGAEGNGISTYPFISADGRFVTFSSYADNLVDGDTNDAFDAFVHNIQYGTTSRISLTSDGVEGNGTSVSFFHLIRWAHHRLRFICRQPGRRRYQ